jgi:hypothetical protein
MDYQSGLKAILLANPRAPEARGILAGAGAKRRRRKPRHRTARPERERLKSPRTDCDRANYASVFARTSGELRHGRNR